MKSTNILGPKRRGSENRYNSTALQCPVQPDDPKLLAKPKAAIRYHPNDRFGPRVDRCDSDTSAQGSQRNNGPGWSMRAPRYPEKPNHSSYNSRSETNRPCRPATNHRTRHCRIECDRPGKCGLDPRSYTPGNQAPGQKWDATRRIYQGSSSPTVGRPLRVASRESDRRTGFPSLPQ